MVNAIIVGTAIAKVEQTSMSGILLQVRYLFILFFVISLFFFLCMHLNAFQERKIPLNSNLFGQSAYRFKDCDAGDTFFVTERRDSFSGSCIHY